MSLLNRASLRNLFQKGKFPSEKHFGHLIDSTVNKVEDGFGKTAKDGLQLSPEGTSDRIMSFYERIDLPSPAWQLKYRNEEKVKGLSFERTELNDEGELIGKSQLFLDKNGRVGIHTDQPRLPFDVKDTAGFHTRVGTFSYGTVPGDGDWHPILCNINGPGAYEIVARINGPKGRGKYAMLHAIAISMFGGKKRRSKVRKTRAHYGWFGNKIDLKWDGTIENNKLLIRTRKHFGMNDQNQGSMIKFHVTQLWDDQLFTNQPIQENECK